MIPDGADTITLIVLILWLLAVIQAMASFWSGVRFDRYVRRMLRHSPTSNEQPPATVFLPCCGVDDRLRETVEALRRQHYADYEIIFTFESADDPAYAAVRSWTSGWTDRRCRLVIAGLAQRRSQKLHNLLAALEEVGPDREVFVFLDSDAVPHADWLASLVSPLAEPHVGATTGYRWYSASGGWVDGVRSAWNAASVSFLHDPRLSFCWGGSMAVRRATFEKCDVAMHWSGALSDDLEITRVLRAAGLTIRFVPQCLIPCHEPAPLGAFLRFARRQLVITRVYSPALWRAGLMLAANFMIGTTTTFLYAAISLWKGHAALGIASGIAWLMLLWLAKGKNMLRQAAVARVLDAPDWTWRDWVYDVLGSEAIGCLHLGLLLSSARGRRVRWRSTEYEMISCAQTRVIRRADAASGPLPLLPGASIQHT